MKKLDWRQWKTVTEYGLNREQTLAKLLDEMIVVITVIENKPISDYENNGLFDYALAVIAEIRNDLPGHPITASIALELRRRGWLLDE